MKKNLVIIFEGKNQDFFYLFSMYNKMNNNINDNKI